MATSVQIENSNENNEQLKSVENNKENSTTDKLDENQNPKIDENDLKIEKINSNNEKSTDDNKTTKENAEKLDDAKTTEPTTNATTTSSQLSAMAAPFVEGATRMNYKNTKPRPLRIPAQNAHFAPGHIPLGYAQHHFIAPMQNFGAFHGPAPAQQANNHHSNTETMPTEELLDLMETINQNVKNSQFSPNLAAHIYRLYNNLKICGSKMEQTHKTELNRVFVSLRQACCRDSGQLGTPCRLKMMELVELRAMNWRPNLSHSQYYVNRPANGFPQNAVKPQNNGTNNNNSSAVAHNNPNNNASAAPSAGDAMSGSEMEQLGAAPVSAPPYGPAVNPFTFNMPASIMPVPDMVSPNATPSYYLIPAAHMGHPATGIAFGPPGIMAAPPPPPMLHPHHPVSATFSTPAGLPSMGASADFPKGAVTKSSNKFNRPTKIPGKNQYRDEVVIRNADSGKIMGVKGRRVSIIEELSKTIISFQKVAQGVKERTLTITGPDEGSIVSSKILIEDTIRRNVSPSREGQEGEILPRPDLDDYSSTHSQDSETNGQQENGDETEFSLSEMGSILKLSCPDPAVLHVARKALNEYFHKHEPLRRASTYDAYKIATSAHALTKERRKSMPLPLNILSNVIEMAELENLSPKTPSETDNMENGLSKANARSTPNLAAAPGRGILKPLRSFTFEHSEVSHDPNRQKIVYTRDFLLQCSNSTVAKSTPNILPAIEEQINEIISPGCESFDPQAYKKKCVDLKQSRV